MLGNVFGAAPCGSGSRLEASDQLQTLSSPNYPDRPAANLRCRWLLSGFTANQSAVQVHFLQLDVGQPTTQQCSGDRIEIEDVIRVRHAHSSLDPVLLLLLINISCLGSGTPRRCCRGRSGSKRRKHSAAGSAESHHPGQSDFEFKFGANFVHVTCVCVFFLYFFYWLFCLVLFWLAQWLEGIGPAIDVLWKPITSWRHIVGSFVGHYFNYW